MNKKNNYNLLKINKKCTKRVVNFQINFDSHLKAVSEMTEIGETVERVDTLIKDTKRFQKLCDVDIERAEEVVAIGKCHFNFAHVRFLSHRFIHFTGQQLISVRGACPKEVVQPKCDELSRVCDMVTERLSRRLEILLKSRDLMTRVEKVRSIFFFFLNPPNFKVQSCLTSLCVQQKINKSPEYRQCDS